LLGAHFIENVATLKSEAGSPLLKRRSFWKKSKKIFKQHRLEEKATGKCMLD
jgi:hypothetical protein